VNVDLGAFALRDAKSFPNMSASNDTMREIAKALRRHVDAATLEMSSMSCSTFEETETFGTL
jgi:hypothetical protein